MFSMFLNIDHIRRCFSTCFKPKLHSPGLFRITATQNSKSYKVLPDGMNVGQVHKLNFTTLVIFYKKMKQKEIKVPEVMTADLFNCYKQEYGQIYNRRVLDTL